MAKFDKKAVEKSAKKIGFIIGILESLVNYILKENHKIQTAIEKFKNEQLYHQAVIKKSVDRIDEISEFIIEHEAEIDKNVKLADKFKDFIS